jgi:hypothetical protein
MKNLPVARGCILALPLVRIEQANGTPGLSQSIRRVQKKTKRTKDPEGKIAVSNVPFRTHRSVIIQ